VEGADLHWRHYNTSLTMLCAMLRHDVDLPVRAVTIFTENLVHENILVRKASLHVVDCVMKKNKKKHPKMKASRISQPSLTSKTFVTNKILESSSLSDSIIISNGVEHLDSQLVKPSGDQMVDGGELVKTADDQSSQLLVQPGERQDNKFLQYSKSNTPTSAESYDQPRFVHKIHFGFYVWPTEDLVYAPTSSQPSLDRTEEMMTPSEQVVFRFFQNDVKVEKLVEFLSLENKKGHDQFDGERFGMFKGLFRNFGDLFLPKIRQHIERLVQDHRESYQRAASELLAAIIRGSKHWPYSKVEPMWEWVVPAIRTALTKVSPETQKDWGTCFATSSDSRDPNKLHWLMEVAMEEPIRSQGSFIDSSRLYMLQGVVAQQRWRVGELLHRLLEFLQPFLNHPYHNVRSRLGAVLTNIFALDIHFEGRGNASQTSPEESKFVAEVLPQLAVLAEEGDQSEARDSSLRLLQTLSKWISSSCVSHVGPVKGHVFQFLPLLLGFEWYDNDPQIARDCQTALSCLSRVLLPASTLPIMLKVVRQSASSATSWRTRLSSLDFLQAVVFNNFMLLCSPSLPEHMRLRDEVLQLVVGALRDKQIEVRVKAAQVLGGLVHCQFIRLPQFSDIIRKFQVSLQDKNQQVQERHGAVLGLCSFVTAFPHTVPTFLPSLLVYLGHLLHDKQPIPATIKKSLQSFKRTHQDNWDVHKAAFSEDQLTDLTNLLVSPSYYA